MQKFEDVVNERNEAQQEREKLLADVTNLQHTLENVKLLSFGYLPEFY